MYYAVYLRRAVRYAKQININRPFMFELVPVVGEIMEDFYPEVKEKQNLFKRLLKMKKNVSMKPYMKD